MPAMVDAPHQQRTVKFNRSRREVFAILKVARLNRIYFQRFHLPVDAAQLKPIVDAAFFRVGVAQ